MPEWTGEDGTVFIGRLWVETGPGRYLATGNVQGSNEVFVLLEDNGQVTVLLQLPPLAAERLISMVSAVLEEQLSDDFTETN